MNVRELIAQRNARIYGDRMDPAHAGMDDMADHAEAWHLPHMGNKPNDATALNVSEGGLRLDTHRPIPAACSGPCDQGRKGCPHPQACQRPDEDQQSADAAMFLKLLVMSTLSVLLCMALINWLAGA